eukprot:143153_1
MASGMDRKKREEFLVYGFVRESAKYLTLTIPDVIKNIILSYELFEPFEIISDYVQISGLCNNIITKTTKNGWHNATYGRDWIPSNTNNIITYTIKCIKHLADNGGYQFVMGFVNNKHTFDKNKETACRGDSYVFYQSGYSFANGKRLCIWPDLPKYTTGDTMALILDLSKSTITIDKNNGECVKIIFENIEKGPNILYKFIVTIYSIGGSLEILDMSTKTNSNQRIITSN